MWILYLIDEHDSAVSQAGYAELSRVAKPPRDLRAVQHEAVGLLQSFKRHGKDGFDRSFWPQIFQMVKHRADERHLDFSVFAFRTGLWRWSRRNWYILYNENGMMKHVLLVRRGFELLQTFAKSCRTR